MSHGFDSLELIFECVDKQLLEEQFAEGICLPGKRQQLLLAIRQQKESKPPRQTEMSMYDWFQENDISSYFNAFINKGYETITEDVLSVGFSTEIPLLGQRKKVALAVRKAKEKQGESNNTAVGDKPKASQSFLS